MQEDRVDKLLDQWSEERPELDASALDVVARIKDTATMLRRHEDDALNKLELRMWEYDVLSALRRHGEPFSLPATQLARESLLSSGAMTNRIDRLEQRGLVAREQDSDDRRSINVRLTAAGLCLIETAVEARLQAAEQQLAGLSDEDRNALAAGLKKLVFADD